MQPLISEKQKSTVAQFVPYRRTNQGWEFYLQKRTEDAPINPGLLGLFGGSIERDETVESGVMREIQEELSYAPTKLEYFSRFETTGNVRHVFIEEVGQDFESKVQVHEGDYGKFFLAEDVASDALKFSRVTHAVIPELARYLTS